MKENINENMDITGLQLTNVKICNIVNNEFVSVPEMADNSLAQSIVENTAIPDGEAYIAEADVFSQEDIPVEIALLDDGSQISNLDFSADSFTLDKLFNVPKCDALDLFVFKDVTITLKTSSEQEFKEEPKEPEHEFDDLEEESSETGNMLIFNGKLNMDKMPLSVFKDFLGSDSEIFLQGEIGLSSLDLTEKINPTFAIFTASASMFVPIMDGVILKSAALELVINEYFSIVNMEQNWDIGVTPSVTGELEISRLSDIPFSLICCCSYDSGVLSLNATCGEIKSFMGVNGLDISYLSASMKVGEQKELSLSADLYVDSRAYSFGGIVNSDYAGVYAKAENFTLNDLNNLFHKISNSRLLLPEFDLTFEEVMAGIASSDCSVHGVSLQEGLTLMCSLSVHEFKCKAAAVISTGGVSIKGSIGSLNIGPLCIEDAEINVEIFSEASGKASSFSILGKVTIQNVRLECRAAYEKISGGWNLVVYAGVEAEAFGLGTVFPVLKDSFMDTLKFSKLGFIYSANNAKTQDDNYQFEVKQGLQLMGIMEEIPAISALTGNKQAGLVFSAHIGTTTGLSIQMPDAWLNLGKNVICSPFKINIAVTPSPVFQLVFGMDVIIPNQKDHLHFDFALDVGAVGAGGSVTMKNWWENPFGINNLKIGPETALQLGIVYAQFMATGTPSEFGIAGGLAIGDVTAKMAVNISADPSNQILMGSLSKLEMSDLAAFIKTLSGVDIPAENIPNFLDIRDLELYCAPSGGSIGTIIFEPGFSFSAMLTLFGKSMGMYARFSDSGFTAKGNIDKIDLGVLKIKGLNGENAVLDMELTKQSQTVYIDGAFEFLGLMTAVNVNVSNKLISFMFQKKFLGLLDFTVEGKSKGSLSDYKNLDFSLYAEMNNAINDYIKNNVTGKIDTAISAVNTSISDAQNNVNKAKNAYMALYEPANKKLNDAQKAADKHLDDCVKVVNTEKQKFNASLENAKNNVTNTKNAYNRALEDAKNKISKTQKTYEDAIRSAEAEVTRAKNSYENAMRAAQNGLNTAKAAYDKAFGDASRKLQNARNEVNSLKNQRDSAANSKRNLNWKERIYKGPYYTAIIAGLEVAIRTANGVLYACEGVLQGVRYGTQYSAWMAAENTLKAVTRGVEYTAFESAKAALAGVRYGGAYTAFESAKAALKAVERGSEYTVWQTAEKTLVTVQATGDAALRAAQSTLDNIARTTIYITLEAAKKNLAVIQCGTEFIAFETANAVLEGAKQGTAAVMELSKFVLKQTGDLVNIKQIILTASLKEMQGGKLFAASTKIVIFGKDYDWTLSFDVNNVAGFIESLFVKVFDEAKKLVVGRS